MNDEERRLWTLNNEQLYQDHNRSRKPLRIWIKENRQYIDATINQVLFPKPKNVFVNVADLKEYDAYI